MSQLAKVIASILIIRSIDGEDPTTQQYVYLAFGVVHIIVAVVALVLRFKISQNNDQTIISVPPQKVPFSSEPQAPKDTKVCDYDAEQFTELFYKKVFMVVGIVMFVSFKWGHIVPLLLQCLHNPLQIYQSPLFKIYVLGEEARGELSRPWPQPDPFGFAGNLMKPQVKEVRRYR